MRKRRWISTFCLLTLALGLGFFLTRPGKVRLAALVLRAMPETRELGDRAIELLEEGWRRDTMWRSCSPPRSPG